MKPSKRVRVGELNASFSLGRDDAGEFLVFHARGGSKKGLNLNSQYNDGLETVLHRLAELDGRVNDALVETRVTRKMNLTDAECRLRLDEPSLAYPIRLRGIGRTKDDFVALRKAMGRAQIHVGQAKPSRKGNSTKRIKIYIETPDHLSLTELERALGQPSRQDGHSGASAETFVFTPGGPPSKRSTSPSPRRGTKPTVNQQLHRKIQDCLYKELVGLVGKENVGYEQPSGSGLRKSADLVVRHSDGYSFYEIKTDSSARECVRQALGQLLEYAHWPYQSPPDIKDLYTVGPGPIDPRTEEYLKGLREGFGLHIRYRHSEV